MEHLGVPVMHVLRPVDGPLLSLGDGFAARFHSWHGASGRRYVTSVCAVDPGDPGPPEFEACVLLAVTRVGEARRIIGVTAIERGSDRRYAGAGAGGPIDEWHVHFLAGDRRERAALVADLRARHSGRDTALSA